MRGMRGIDNVNGTDNTGNNMTLLEIEEIDDISVGENAIFETGMISISPISENYSSTPRRT